MIRLSDSAFITSRDLTRHMGIFGATGTGKTTTLASIAEQANCPCLILDVKGDLESLGSISYPAMRIDSADIMARALDLSDAQSGALQICMAWAADNGIELQTLVDLRAALHAMDSAPYGLASRLSVAAIMRAMLRLERATPWLFRADDFDARRTSGRHIVSCAAIAEQSGLYGAYAAQLLDSLYRGLGEIGDSGAGLLVMIDESHLLFDGATPAIVRRIEQVTRLIRSRGVGLIYVTQSPADLPDAIAGQLATRVQHGLRATTRRGQSELRAAAETMAGNVTDSDILGLGIGEAFISVANRPATRARIRRGKLALHPAEKPPLPLVRAPAAIAEPAPAPSAPAPRAKRPFWHYVAGGYGALFALELFSQLFL